MMTMTVMTAILMATARRSKHDLPTYGDADGDDNYVMLVQRDEP